MAYQALLLRQNKRIIQEAIRCCSTEIEYLTRISPDVLIVLMGKPLQWKKMLCFYIHSNVYITSVASICFLASWGYCLISFFFFFFTTKKNQLLFCSFNIRKAVSKHSLPLSSTWHITDLKKQKRSEMAASELHFYMV